jgi:hypothetical protein
MKKILITLSLACIFGNAKSQSGTLTTSSNDSSHFFKAASGSTRSLFSIGSTGNFRYIHKPTLQVFNDKHELVASIDTFGKLTVIDSLATIKAFIKYLNPAWVSKH